MKTSRRLIIELDSQDIEEIIESHVIKLMESKGFTLNRSNRDEPYPDIQCIGESKEEENYLIPA